MLMRGRLALFLLAVVPLFAFAAPPTSSTATTLSVRILGTTQCSDGVDNDGDGYVDYPVDPGCVDYSDDDEANALPSVGGGGSGGVSYPTTAMLTLSGFAYPTSTVTIMRNGVVVGTAATLSNGQFQTKLSGLTPGTGLFSLYATDSLGTKSASVPVTVSMSAGVTTDVAGIAIPLTITTDKQQVKPGDVITVSGFGIPVSAITITLSKPASSTRLFASGAGKYQHVFSIPGSSSVGTSTVQAHATLEGKDVGVSEAIIFTVGTTTINRVRDTSCRVGTYADVNCDKKVNLTDFSIVAFWFKKPSPPAYVDLNGDGKVTLVDLSILAFYWTG